MSTHGHRGAAPREVGCAVVTVSDTRREADDLSGAEIRAQLGGAGYPVRSYVIVRDESEAIRGALNRALERADTRAVIMNGGTGVAPRDVTIESIAGLWTKELPGFGELFRALSYAEIGPPAFLSRATAGVLGGKFVAVLPGSPAACRLAMERLILPELAHVAALLAGAP
jgi:molybdenum cofactor biosynthesis protein B